MDFPETIFKVRSLIKRMLVVLIIPCEFVYEGNKSWY